ncbi:DUF3310 domain-containing protein [Bifidobacterium sp. SO1]|uniref:DUF3310 domain-containing protein n=1 Tax=Bifidobacterium sp. SO1 TaxID=2809029 RepID=UPI001BDC3869|nr:DUF3310 domain-containing protein [Bifidobacterium sp. SO1]MBT1161256.1 DUF3310 domain-containing protein [Bifidobacterium sp. SO1]
MTDNVEHPQHYESGPYECILLTEQYSFNVGNMIKYVWRYRLKGHPVEDLQKALWYANRAMQNGEAFHECDRDASDSNVSGIESIYWSGTLLRMKADTVTGTEHDFWLALLAEDTEMIPVILSELLEETQEHG